MSESTARRWLDNRHAIYIQHSDTWRRMERLTEGGPEAIKAELVRWEKNDKDFEARVKQAIYVNSVRDVAIEFVGHIASNYPEPSSGGISFGSLGEVERPEGQAIPDPAELIWYNADGGVVAGTPWVEWWSGAAIRAMAVGHRWMLVEGSKLPPGQTPTVDDELAGLRPYLVEYSPLLVTDWHIEAGRLQYAIIKKSVRRPRLEDGILVGLQPEDEYYVHVRKGWQAFDETEASDTDGQRITFSSGGWWRFDKERRLIGAAEGQPETGDYDWNRGEIPMFLLVGEQSQGTTDVPAMSRPALYEIGQAQVSLMNTLSARQGDALEAAKSILYFLGADEASFNVAMTKILEGARFVPVPATRGTDGSPQNVPQVFDGSTGTVASEVWNGLYQTIVEQLREMTLKLAMTAPNASGVSREAEFGKSYSPRLALLAANIQAAQNTAIHLLEMRWGRARGVPTGEVRLQSRYRLQPLVDGIDRMFDTLLKAGVTSPTLTTNLVMRAAEERGVAGDDEQKDIIRSELEASLDEAKRDRDARRQEALSFDAALRQARAGRAQGDGEDSDDAGDIAA